jgi:hypothetical protein
MQLMPDITEPKMVPPSDSKKKWLPPAIVAPRATPAQLR